MNTDERMKILSENRYLVAYIPATSKAFVWRVISVVNRNSQHIDYGPLPIPAKYPFNSYIGGVVPAPADGVIPGFTYTPVGASLSFPLEGAYEETDMWYLPAKDYKERVFHVITHVTPAWIRTEIQIPKSVVQGRFQKDKVITGIEKLFGFNRGMIEVIHIPGIRYGYRFGNDSSLNVYTGCCFDYGEYIIETPKNAEFIFNILTGKVPSKWISLPIISYDTSVRDAIIDNYGFEGFPLHGLEKREEAIKEYEDLLKEVTV